MLNEHFRIAPAFAYYFKSNDRLGWETNIDVHYLLDIPATEDKCKIYPMVGATILSIGYRDNDEDRYGYSKNKFGADLGGGIQYELFENFTVFGEAKYLIISGADQFELAIGAALHF
jgi:outer membrane protein X